MSRIYGESGEDTPSTPPHQGEVYYFFDRSTAELRLLAMESSSILFVDHAYRIVLGRLRERNADELVPILNDMAKRRKILREWDIASAKSYAQRSVAQRLGGPALHLGITNHETLEEPLKSEMEARLKDLSHILYSPEA